jgi:hypothetical protein
MYALISDDKIVQMSESTFEVHSDLCWIEILNYEEGKQYAYLNDEIIEVIPKHYIIEI